MLLACFEMVSQPFEGGLATSSMFWGGQIVIPWYVLEVVDYPTESASSHIDKMLWVQFYFFTIHAA
jgi:hypothetical protein